MGEGAGAFAQMQLCPGLHQMSWFGDWVGKSVGRLEEHTCLPRQYYTNLPVKLGQPLVALGKAIGRHILAVQSDEGFCVDERTVPLGFVWVVHLAQFGGAVSFLQSRMGFLSRADAPGNVPQGLG